MTTILRLDEAFKSAESETLEAIKKRLPDTFTKNVLEWKFGEYGWTSPVNLMLTAAWYKWLNPTQDVCRIWGQDHNKKKIEGGFAIRSMDEKFTVPLVTKTGISQGFCSPNSGMQGSRAIEKMRAAGRIDRDTPIDQSVSFDMSLFQSIMNDIDDLNSSQAFDGFKLLLKLGIQKKERRIQEQRNLFNTQISSALNQRSFLEFVDNISDPQFIKIACACIIENPIQRIFGDSELCGMSGAKTASDAQSKTPGDFWFLRKTDNKILGAEVKDKSKTIGFEILQAIENRKRNNMRMTDYVAICAGPTAVSETVIKDPRWKMRIGELRETYGVNVMLVDIVNLMAMFNLSGGDFPGLIDKISHELAKTIDLKNNTIKSWTEFIQN